MSPSLIERAFDALAGAPIVQYAAAVLLLVVAALIAVNALRNKQPKSSNGSAPLNTPIWLMMGPVADAITSLRNLAEEARANRHILERIESSNNEMARELREQTQLIEDIRNNQVQRGDLHNR